MKRNQKYKEKIAVFLIGLILGGIAVLGWQWFWHTYRFQSPVIIKFQSPLIRRQKEVIKQKGYTTPTPTPNPVKSHLKGSSVDVISKVYASERYSYQTALLDEKQKEVMIIVEQRLGKAGAQLVFKESGFHPTIINSSSGACGLFQSYPCSKMNCELSDIDCQLDWGENYIKNRYGTPEKALEFHKVNNWY